MAAKKKAATKKKAVAKKIKIEKPKNGVQYTQSEFFKCFQEACEIESKKEAREIYDSFAGMLHTALKKGYKIPLPGIGKFQVRKSKARMGRNPATGEAIKISAKKRVKLTPNKALKDAVL